MQQESRAQLARRFWNSVPVKILSWGLTYALYYFLYGWHGVLGILAVMIIWKISTLFFQSPNQSARDFFDSVPERIFLALLVVVTSYLNSGLKDIWIPIVVIFLWDVFGRKLFIRGQKK